MDKSELRAQLKAARLSLSPEEHRLKSQAITARLETVTDWSKIGHVHAFMPIASLGEVDIMPFVQSLTCAVSYPAKVNGEWIMDDSVAYDVIIVPMLGFDASLHRLGHGGGYYDKFLSTQPKATKIGVCFELGKAGQLPVEPHDIPLDTIVTETSIY